MLSAVLKRIVLAPVRVYQRVLSPLKPMPTCRYLPTCSCYAVEAVEKRGVIVGSLKAMWRLLRCNPLFRGGYDPVDPVAEPTSTPTRTDDVPGEVQS